MKDTQILVSLEDVISITIGDISSGIDKCPIPPSLAHTLHPLLKDSIQYKVTFQSHDERELDWPLLWRYTDWMLSNERYQAAKARAERERVARWISSQNIRRLTNALMREQKLDESYATKLAINLLNKNTPWEVLHILGMNQTLITKEEELE